MSQDHQSSPEEEQDWAAEDASSDNTDVSINEEEKQIFLLQTQNKDNEVGYVYLQAPASEVMKLARLIRDKEAFLMEDIGWVLAEGEGFPPPEDVIQGMVEEWDIITPQELYFDAETIEQANQQRLSDELQHKPLNVTEAE